MSSTKTFIFILCLVCAACSKQNDSNHRYSESPGAVRDTSNTIATSPMSPDPVIKDEASITYDSSKVDLIDSLLQNPEQYFIPSVQFCLYIRSSPEISDDNIIQCLIPHRSEEYVTAMYHELLPTGETQDGWAEFRYSFDIYTMKPDVQEDVEFRKWRKLVDQRHEKLKQEFHARRMFGWLKYRNSDGSHNIVPYEHKG